MNYLDFLTSPITVFGGATNWLEVIASITFGISVILANFRHKILYPIGIIGTILFFFVFWFANLYSSAGLQVYFTFIQLYGWWFWMKGNKGAERGYSDEDVMRGGKKAFVLYPK